MPPPPAPHVRRPDRFLRPSWWAERFNADYVALKLRNARVHTLRHLRHLRSYRPWNVPDDPVFVVAVTRTGSTMLIDLLDQLPDVEAIGEVLNPRSRDGARMTDSPRVARRHIRIQLGRLRAPVRCVKLLLFQMASRDMTPDRLVADYPGARFVVLWRRSLFDQRLSSRVAAVTGRYHRPVAEGSPERPNPVTLDPVRLENEYEKTRTHYEAFLASPALQGRTILVAYEDLSDDPHTVLADIARFIGAEPGEVTIRSVRTTPWRPEEVVANLAELDGLVDAALDVEVMAPGTPVAGRRGAQGT